LGDQRTRPFDESYTLYEEIELECQTWDENFQPQFFSFESAQNQYRDYSLRAHVVSWVNLAEYAALAGHMLYLEDGPDVMDLEQEKDQGEVLENMYAPGCTSANQAASPQSSQRSSDVERRLRRESGRAGGQNTVSG
jgi:hypothetical protein